MRIIPLYTDLEMETLIPSRKQLEIDFRMGKG